MKLKDLIETKIIPNDPDYMNKNLKGNLRFVFDKLSTDKSNRSKKDLDSTLESINKERKELGYPTLSFEELKKIVYEK